VGHGKLFVDSNLRRRISRPHHICDTKLPDGAMELLRLAVPDARKIRLSAASTAKKIEERPPYHSHE
jgi:hypothetical protein